LLHPLVNKSSPSSSEFLRLASFTPNLLVPSHIVQYHV
jgi:hypothetical protein